MIVPMKKLGPVLLVVSSSIVINMGYLSSSLYEVPGVLTAILVPSLMVTCIGWFQRSMRRTIVLTLAVIILSGVLLLITLSAPVLFGVIADPDYAQMFVYSAFLRVVQRTLLTSFFALLTALLAGLAFE